jgi:protease I
MFYVGLTQQCGMGRRRRGSMPRGRPPRPVSGCHLNAAVALISHNRSGASVSEKLKQGISYKPVRLSLRQFHGAVSSSRRTACIEVFGESVRDRTGRMVAARELFARRCTPSFTAPAWGIRCTHGRAPPITGPLWENTMDTYTNPATLHGINVAILVTDGFEQVELTSPCDALEAAGAITRIISVRKGKVQGYNHDQKADEFEVNLTFVEAEPDAFDAVLLPGGAINGQRIREIPEAQQFVRGMQEEGKPIAAICHGPWLLASAGLVGGRTMTSAPDISEDLRRAGANWVNREVVQDGNLVSSRKPDDLPAFNHAMIDVMSERVKASVRGTADERPDVGAGS